ncbi:ZNF3 protein, partial [Pachycephala philippinensis]|nr:ZNF3 protein [Pachycephala philippinensis]
CWEGSWSYSRSRDLVFHEWLHPREKPYKCLECRKGFKWSSHLICQQKIHSKERP